MEKNDTVGLIRNNGNVNHPAHYTQGGIECIEAMKAATVGKEGFEAVLVGNIIKYLWRYESKGGIEDVEKAMWYLARLHKELVDKRMRYKPIINQDGVTLETPWGTYMKPKDGDMFTMNEKARASLLKSLLERGGYCPCQPNLSRDTMCPCKNYRDNGKCICGLFVKIPQSVDVEENKTEEEVKNDNGQTESIRVDTEATDSTEQQEEGKQYGTEPCSVPDET